MQERLKFYGIHSRIDINDSVNNYTLWLPEKAKDEVVKSLISKIGKVEIWETWNDYGESMEYSTDSIFEYISVPPFFNQYNPTPYFMVNKKDRSIARRKILEYAAQKGWPQNIRFLWGEKPLYEDENTYELYMLRSSSNPQAPVISNEDIVKTSSGKSNYGSSWNVSIELNSNGSKCFERVTRANIGKALAIVIDNKVFSAPNVASEITGGKLDITGNFTEEEARELATIIRLKALPMKVIVK